MKHVNIDDINTSGLYYFNKGKFKLYFIIEKKYSYTTFKIRCLIDESSDCIDWTGKVKRVSFEDNEKNIYELNDDEVLSIIGEVL